MGFNYGYEKKKFDSNRQILRRIDRHERIVVGRTGKAGKFHYYCYKGGKKDDIGRIKA